MSDSGSRRLTYFLPRVSPDLPRVRAFIEQKSCHRKNVNESSPGTGFDPAALWGAIPICDRLPAGRFRQHRNFTFMNEELYLEPTLSRSPAFLYRRISWGAVFAGLMVSIVTQLTLTLLGVTIGAATVDPLQEQDPTKGLALGSAIWLLATGLISMFFGAYIAGRLSGGPRRADGLLHGVVTWSAATLAMIFLAVTATGTLVGGLGRLVGGAMSKAPSSQGSAQSSSMASVEEKVKELFPQTEALLPTGRGQPETPAGTLSNLAKDDAQLAAALAKMETHGGAAQSPSDRDEALNLLVTKHGMEQQQAMNMITQWDQQIQQTKAQAEEKARQVGDVAANKLSQGALWAFIALLLGGSIAAWGGWVGTASLPRRIETVAAPSA